MKKNRPSNPWPWLLVAIAVTFLYLSGWSVYRANDGVSAVIATDAEIPGGSKRLLQHHE